MSTIEDDLTVLAQTALQLVRMAEPQRRGFLIVYGSEDGLTLRATNLSPELQRRFATMAADRTEHDEWRQVPQAGKT